jgi:hypothetical protein
MMELLIILAAFVALAVLAPRFGVDTSESAIG